MTIKLYHPVNICGNEVVARYVALGSGNVASLPGEVLQMQLQDVEVIQFSLP